MQGMYTLYEQPITARILMSYSNELCKIMHVIRVLLNKPFEYET